MQAAAEGGLVSARLLPQKLDPGDALMWLIAIGTLWVAAQWAGSDFLLESSFRRRSAEGGTPREVMLVLLPPNAMLAAVDGVVTSGRLNQVWMCLCPAEEETLRMKKSQRRDTALGQLQMSSQRTADPHRLEN